MDRKLASKNIRLALVITTLGFVMFGITFVGHPYPHKLYLPGDFEGNPLRKDFPLLARRVKPWPGIVDVEPMPDAGTDGGEEGA